MKKILASLSAVVLPVALAQAAIVSHGSTTLLSTSQNGDGSEVVNLTAGAASAAGSSLLGGMTLGDGTVEEYLFVNTSGVSDASPGALNVYTSLGSSISTPTFPASTVNVDADNVTVTLPDGSTVFNTGTGARASDANGTIQTSGYNSGTVYFIFGTAADYAQVAFGGEISGFVGSQDSGTAFDTTGTPFDFSGSSLSGNGTAIAAFTFDNVSDGFADTLLDYRAINTDLDGSRARFYGVVIDGVAVPEPATLGMIGVIGAGMLFVRRRFML